MIITYKILHGSCSQAVISEILQRSCPDHGHPSDFRELAAFCKDILSARCMQHPIFSSFGHILTEIFYRSFSYRPCVTEDGILVYLERGMSIYFRSIKLAYVRENDYFNYYWYEV